MYFLRSNEGQEQIKARTGGSSQPKLALTRLADVIIRTPDVLTQNEIASILLAYDDLIENNARRIKILEQTAQAIYTEWFVNFRFPDHEKVKVDADSIPAGWRVLKLRDCLKYYIGGGWGNEEKTDDFSFPAYVIRGTDISKIAVGNISECPLRFHKESNFINRRAEALDIIFEVSGGSKGQPVGRHHLITQELLNQFNKDVIFASFCKLVRVNQDIVSPYQVSLLFSDFYEKELIMKYQTQSTGISNFKFEQFIDDVDVVVPTSEVSSKFANTCAALFAEIARIGSINSNLRMQRDLLLPKLITGEIKV